MNVRHDAEYERTYDAADKYDQNEYAWYLWEKRATRNPTQEQETYWWDSKGRFCFYFSSSTVKRVSFSMLQATRTKTADRTQRHGAGCRKQKDEGNTKGSRPLAMQRLRKANKSNGYEGLRDYRDHKNY